MSIPKPEMSRPTQLLVSFRDPSEWLHDMTDLVDIVDLKEPRHGALGPVSENVFDIFRHKFAGNRPLSVALGELSDYDPRHFETNLKHAAFVKIGLSKMGSNPGWRSYWRDAMENLPKGVAGVSVAYGDYWKCDAPEPEEILDAASTVGCRYFLLDTFDKDSGSIMDLLPSQRIARLISQSRFRGIHFALAGGVGQDNLKRALALGPDIIGIRGAVTVGSRSSEISFDRLKAFRKKFDELCKPTINSKQNIALRLS